jgi:dTDP-4-dehydrorhamnose reductase
MRKVLITGASGQLGKEFVKVLSSKGIDFVALERKDLDIANFEKVYKTLKEINPSIVINCSAYNQEEWDEVYSKVYSKYVTTNQR